MRVNIFGLGVQSRSKAVATARLQNVYVENRPSGERSETVAYGIPGLDLFANAGDTPWRALLPVETTAFFYGVHLGTLYKIDNTATLTALGTLNTTTGRVSMAHNGDVILIVDGTNGYTYTISTNTFAQVSDVDFLNGAKTCTWLDQLFVVEDGEEIATSPDGTNWDATDRAVAESSPDGIVHVLADHGELNILGAISTEYWVTTPAVDFALQPLKSNTAEWGCAAQWSVVKANDSVIFLAKNRDGQASVVRLNGYVPQVISTPDLDAIINGYTTVLDATALAYKVGGHPFYQINFPSADASWLFDALTGRWHPIKSYQRGRHRAEIGIQYLARTIVSDSSTGKLYKINPATYSENGEVIEAELISETVRMPDGERFPVDRLRIDMERGVGLATGQGSDPQVMLQVSRDGGNTWGAEMWESAGAVGQYKRRVEWRRLGTSDQWTFKVRVTDPVKRVFVSASINPID